MKKIILMSAVSAVCVFAGGVDEAVASEPIDIVSDNKTPIYIGLGVGVREIEEFNYFYGSLLAGYEFSDYFGLEGRYNIANNYNTIGGYFKAQYPTEMLTPYLLAGYAHSDLDYSDLKTNYSGFSWGGGVDITTPYDNLKVFGDVMTYEGADAIYDTEHVLTIGVKYFFN